MRGPEDFEEINSPLYSYGLENLCMIQLQTWYSTPDSAKKGKNGWEGESWGIIDPLLPFLIILTENSFIISVQIRCRMCTCLIKISQWLWGEGHL